MIKIKIMNVDFLKEVLSIPSISGSEGMVRDYIKDFAITNNIEYFIDKKGNIYLTKGILESESEYYPCVVSHIDTVHTSHISLITHKQTLDIKEDDSGVLTAYLPDTKTQTGIGGDDKCGVYVCLEMFGKFDKLKGAFFVEEEIGMRGSKESDDNFFSNVGYAIQFDAPSDNWITEICYGVKLFDEDFKELITESLNDCGYTKFSKDPFTDVNQLASKYDFNCLNLGCGYYRQHTSGEYVVISEVSNSLKAGETLIKKLGVEKYTHKKVLITENSYKPFFEGDDDDDDDFYSLEGDYNEKFVEEVVSLVLFMSKNGYTKEEIKGEVYTYLNEFY